MLVDTSVTPAAARALVAQIKDELTPKPIKYVFNSHYHFDHAHGNQIFGDDVEIVGHEYIRADAPDATCCSSAPTGRSPRACPARSRR